MTDMQQTTSSLESNEIFTSTSETSFMTESSIDYDIDWGKIINTLSNPNHNISHDFLLSLREYYFYGCESKINSISPFCYNRKNHSKFDDLTNFEHSTVGEIENVDEIWLQILKESVKYFLINGTMLNFPKSENLIDYLINNATNTTTYTKITTDTYRLYFCFYIDSIILENKINNFTSFKTNLDKIQLLVGFFIIPLYDEYLENMEQDNLENFGIFVDSNDMDKFTTLESKVIQCNFSDFPENINFQTIVSEVHTIYGVLTLTEYMANRKAGALAGEKLNFICPDGQTLIGEKFSVCGETGIWSNVDSYCQGMFLTFHFSN